MIPDLQTLRRDGFHRPLPTNLLRAMRITAKNMGPKVAKTYLDDINRLIVVVKEILEKPNGSRRSHSEIIAISNIYPIDLVRIKKNLYICRKCFCPSNI